MKKIIFIFKVVLVYAALTTMSSCEKMNTNDFVEEEKSEANLVLNVITTGNEAITRADNNKFWTRLNFVIYKNGKKVKSINQSEDDEDYGQAKLKLEEDTYQVLVLAHSSDGNPTTTTADKIQFTNAMGFTDTFYYYDTITVTNTKQTHNITLNRVTAMLRFIINDAMPPEVSNLKFYYTGGSGALNATTGLGCVESKQTVIIPVEPSSLTSPYSFDLYTIPREPTAKLSLTVTAYDETQTVIQERIFKDVEVETNKITEFGGTFFTNKTNPEDKEDPDDPGNTSESEDDIFMISANTTWAGTITKSY